MAKKTKMLRIFWKVQHTLVYPIPWQNFHYSIAEVWDSAPEQVNQYPKLTEQSHEK